MQGFKLIFVISTFSSNVIIFSSSLTICFTSLLSLCRNCVTRICLHIAGLLIAVKIHLPRGGNKELYLSTEQVLKSEITLVQG